eukprot:Nk52_evm6s278 gene=Nk52_evmTU6s278
MDFKSIRAKLQAVNNLSTSETPSAKKKAPASSTMSSSASQPRTPAVKKSTGGVSKAASSSRKRKMPGEGTSASGGSAIVGGSKAGSGSKSRSEGMKKIDSLRETQLNVRKAHVNLSDLKIGKEGGVGKEVVEMTDEDVAKQIERIVVSVAESIVADKGFSFVLPSRSSSNQVYVPELDRIVLGTAVSTREFASASTVRKTAITSRILELVHEVVKRKIHITKRDLFYTDVKLFQKQSESDPVIDDVACMVGCTRSSLNVVASEKGVVIGRVQFRDSGDFIDCTRMGTGGKAIPSLVDNITDIQGDAKFVLLVEKDAAFMRLSEDRFYNDYPCIIITAKGQPDVSTRIFLKMVTQKLNIPILGLVDSDPYGLKILSVYMSGSKNMSYDSAHLTSSDIKWLGVRPSDLDRYQIPKECRLEMSEFDIKTGQELLKEEFVKKNKEWYKELEMMVKRKEKAEIQALSNFGFQYLTKNYLPRKLEQGDWI